METTDSSKKIFIRSEQIGSIPRPAELVAAQQNYRYGLIGRSHLQNLRDQAIHNTIRELEKTGSKVVTDGEQGKSSFLTYPIYGLTDEHYAFSSHCFALTYSDGHKRSLPHLIKAPFRYATYAQTYIDEALKHTNFPIKQTVIAPSALSMVYPKATIDGYSREEFLNDLMNEAETDIRKCFESGAHSVQLDFTEARFSLKLDPTRRLLHEFIHINNRVLNRFETNLRHRIGVHVCSGVDKGCSHSMDVEYRFLLPALFQLHVGNFFLQLASEPDRPEILSCIRGLIKPSHRIFIGVINPLDPRVETPDEVCERVLEAAEYIPVEQLGTTDDCGFAPFDDDQSIPRQIAFDKIRARIQGTKMAEQKLNIIRKITDNEN